MENLVIKKESFKFKIFDQAPTAEPGQSILLYRNANGSNGSMLIDEGFSPYAADVRRGKYDTKVTFTMEPQTFQMQEEVLIKNYTCHFIMNLNIYYRLHNVREYYFNASDSFEKGIEACIKELSYSYDGKFTLYQGKELERELDKEINTKLLKFSYLNIISVSTEVKPDAEAMQFINSDADKNIKIHKTKNEAEVEIKQNEQKKEIERSAQSLNRTKSEGLIFLAQQYGELAPIIQSYFDGKIDGQQLYKTIQEKKATDMKYITDGWNNDMLSGEFIERQFADKIAGKSLTQERVLTIEENDAASPSDKPDEYIDVPEIGDDDYL